MADPQITALTIAINNLSNIIQKQSSTASASVSGRPQPTYDRSGTTLNSNKNNQDLNKMTQQYKTATKQLQGMVTNASVVTDALANLKSGVVDSAKQFKSLQDAAKDLVKNMATHDGLTSKMQGKVLKSMQEQIKASSRWADGLIKSANTVQDVDQILEDVGKELNLYQEQLEKLQTESLGQVKDTKRLRTILRVMGNRSKEYADLLKKYNLDTDEGLAKAAKAVDEQVLANKKLTASILDEVRTKAKGAKLDTALDSAKKGLTRILGRKTGWDKLATGMGSLGMLADGANRLYKDYRNYAGKGFGGETFGVVQSNSILQGMTADQFSDLMRQNMNAVVQNDGAAGFSRALLAGKFPFMKAGLSAADSAKATANAIDTGSTLGIKASDAKQMGTFIKAYAEQFKDLRATTGFTADEFDKFNDTMLNNTTIQGKLSTLNEKDRVLLQKQLIEEAKKLKLTGLSNEAMAKTITTLNDLQNQGVQDRFTQGANIRAAGSMVGLNEEASRIQSTMLKGRSATPEELAQMAKDMAAIQKEIDKLQNSGSVADQIKADALQKLVGKQTEEVGRSINVAQPGKELTEQQVQAQRNRGELSNGMTAANAVYDSGKALINNPLTTAVLGAVGAFIASPLKSMVGKAISGALSKGTGATPSGSGGPGIGTQIADAGKTAWSGLKDFGAGLFGKGKVPGVSPSVTGTNPSVVGSAANAASTASQAANAAGKAANGAKAASTAATGVGDAAKAAGAMGKFGKILGKGIPGLGAILGVTDIGMGLYNHDGGQVGGGIGSIAGTGIGTLLGGPIGAVIGGVAGNMLGSWIGNLVSPTEKTSKAISDTSGDNTEVTVDNDGVAKAIVEQTDQLLGINAKLQALVDLMSKNLALEQEKADTLRAARLDQTDRWAPTQQKMIASWNY